MVGCTNLLMEVCLNGTTCIIEILPLVSKMHLNSLKSYNNMYITNIYKQVFHKVHSEVHQANLHNRTNMAVHLQQT